MTPMRKFRCAACGHEFEVPYGTGQRGRDMTCPACGQPPVHRVDTGGRGRATGGGGGPWWARRATGAGRGPWWARE
jgi:putative FmdB family regulatory protein